MIRITQAQEIQDKVDDLVNQLNGALSLGQVAGLRFEVNITERQAISHRHPAPVIDVLTFVSPNLVDA